MEILEQKITLSETSKWLNSLNSTVEVVEGEGSKVEDRSIEIIQSKKEWEKKSGKISRTSEAWQTVFKNVTYGSLKNKNETEKIFKYFKNKD